jgi:hypothetical protein
MRIEDIADFPALRELTRALWKTGKSRGAAILVGAGFSRNADRIQESTPEPPLWTDLAAAMAKQIYPHGEATSNQLRLAEEFKAVLGEPALECLIKELVRDEELLPGELHRKLVRLPWTDILTTNWDTLIERAALENLGQTYETVCCVGDIATTRAPRVVKLHGSLPSNRPFIISEEDYRTYPKIFAPFVNLVQQVLLENELCLLGFSGDDPNFLEWSGWIRDQLGASARRIHLVGALNLSPSSRRLLESRNISPIDLSPLLEGNEPYNCKQRIAAEKFIDYLLATKPRPVWDWPQTEKTAVPPLQNIQSQTPTVLLDTARRWASQRLAYPGWVICPSHIRESLRGETVTLLYWINQHIEQLSPTDRGHIVFEFAWRADTFFIPIPDQVAELFRRAFYDEKCWLDRESRQFVGVVLLRTAREERNLPLFDEIRTFCDSKLPPDPDLATSILYQRCLWARDELNFKDLKDLLQGLEGVDPIWKARRAALYCDLGDFKTAREVISHALREIRERFYRNRESLWILSRLAWTQFLSRSLQRWDSFGQDDTTGESDALNLRFFETKTDPWDIIAGIERKIEESLRSLVERTRTKEPLFEAGTYRDHSNTLYFGSWSPQDAVYEVARIVDVAGAPARADHIDIMNSRLERAEALTGFKYEDESDNLRLLRVVQSGKDDLLKRTFGRIQVARLAEDTCTLLRRILNRALDFAIQQITFRQGFSDDFWSRRAAVYTEILSRLAVRLTEKEALALFSSGLKLSADPRWKVRELLEPLGNLLTWSLSAVSPAKRSSLITEILQFPLPDEAGITHPFDRDWPDSFKWLSALKVSRPIPETEYAARVAVLIAKAQDCPIEIRSRAVRLLTRLYLAGALTSKESEQFGNALWARRKSDVELPIDTTLYSHMFLLLPSPDNKEKVRTLVMSRCHELSSSDHFISLASAAQKRADGTRGLILTRDEAIGRLTGILAWHPQEDNRNPFSQMNIETLECRRAIGAVLADAVFPALGAGDLSTDQIEGCLGLLEKNLVFSTAQALPEFLRVAPACEDRIIEALMRAMVSIESDAAWAGFNGIYRWMIMSREGILPKMPRRVVETLVSVIETRREPGLLHAVNIAPHLIEAAILGKDDMERLSSALGLVFIEFAYADQGCTDERAITFTLLRAASVKMADSLRQAGVRNNNVEEWITSAAKDPIPEVRFAVITPDELM